MEVAEAAYIAGIIDGEGHIRVEKHTTRNYRPLVAVDSTDRELLDWLVQVVGGRIVIKKKREDHHSQAWTWRVTWQRAVGLLEETAPYMKINRKRERAEIIVRDYADKSHWTKLAKPRALTAAEVMAVR